MYLDTKTYAQEKLKDMEAYDAFVGELNADVVSRVYEDLKGITNATYMANIVAADQWWTKKYFIYMKDAPMTSANINSIQFDTTVVSCNVDYVCKFLFSIVLCL